MRRGRAKVLPAECYGTSTAMGALENQRTRARPSVWFWRLDVFGGIDANELADRRAFSSTTESELRFMRPELRIDTKRALVTA